MAATMATKIASMVLIWMVVGLVATPHIEAAITCSSVGKRLLPCSLYFQRGAGPSSQCCSAVKTLRKTIKTTADRQTACSCLKTVATNYDVFRKYAATLSSKCHVSIPFKISPTTDCKKVK